MDDDRANQIAAQFMGGDYSGSSNPVVWALMQLVVEVDGVAAAIRSLEARLVKITEGEQ